MNTENEYNRKNQYGKMYRYMAIGGCVCAGIIIILILCRNFLWKSTDDKTNSKSENCFFTYKIGEEDVQYTTFERIGEKSFKISFHSTLENPGTDYIITTNHIRLGYPPLTWSYLEGDNNQIFLSNNDTDPFWLDTIVSRNYEFLSTNDLYRCDTVKSLDDIHRDREWSTSLWKRPYKYRAYVRDFASIEYKDSTVKSYLDYKEAPIVASGYE